MSIRKRYEIMAKYEKKAILTMSLESVKYILQERNKERKKWSHKRSRKNKKCDQRYYQK